MSQDLLRVKYPSSQRPTLVYSNASGSINLAPNHTDTPPPASGFNAADLSVDPDRGEDLLGRR